MINPKITILDISKYTNMSASLIRKLMRDGVLNIGICVKHGSKWYYHIIEKDLRNAYGDKLVNTILKDKKEGNYARCKNK